MATLRLDGRLDTEIMIREWQREMTWAGGLASGLSYAVNAARDAHRNLRFHLTMASIGCDLDPRSTGAIRDAQVNLQVELERKDFWDRRFEALAASCPYTRTEVF